MPATVDDALAEGFRPAGAIQGAGFMQGEGIFDPLLLQQVINFPGQ